jgi:hypothetical protein
MLFDRDLGNGILLPTRLLKILIPRAVEEPSVGHFYWPDLDVDLTAEIIEDPERFPLKMH